MGNRAVITTSTTGEVQDNNIGIYLHWQGGYDSVSAFLTYCKLKEHRSPESDCYGWARLCQVIGNYLGGTTSIGIDVCGELDCDNGNQGVFFIKNWEVVGRQYQRYGEQKIHPLREMLHRINEAQPESERIQDLDVQLDKLLSKEVG